jgi:hypothetical protein
LAFVVLLGKRFVGNFLYGMTLLSFIGAFLVLQLWFYQFMDHDYYVIPGYMFVIFLLLSAIVLFKKHFAHIYQSWIFRAMVVGFLALNIWHANSTIKERYTGKLQYKLNEHLYEPQFQDYMVGLGIDRQDMVISVPDKSPCSSLYLINRPGFSEWLNVNGAPLYESHVRDFIRRGAQYLIVHDKNYLEQDNIKNFLEYEIGDYKGIKIYSLKNY